MSLKGIFRYRCRRNPGKLYNAFCYTCLTKDHPPPSNLVVYSTMQLFFLTFSALVANPKKTTLHDGQSRCSWSAEQEKKKKSGSTPPPPPLSPCCSFGENENENHATHPHFWALRKSASRRSRSVSRPYKDSYDSSARPMGVAPQNSTLPCAIATFPVSLPLYSPGDVWPRLPLLPSTRP